MSTGVELPPRPPAVPREEFETRRSAARAIAAEANLDGLLVWGSHTWTWPTAYLADHRSGMQQQGATTAVTFGDKNFTALVIPVDGDPVLILDQRVGPGDVAVDDVRTTAKLVPEVARVLRATGLDRGTLGIVGEGALLERHRRGIESELGARLDLRAADHLIEPLQRIKSPTEQALLRHASLVGSRWMDAMMAAAEPGRTEADLVVAGLPVLLHAGGWPNDVVIGSGNPCRPQAARGIPSYNSVRPIERGDLLRIDGFGPVVDGYGCDLARSACVGADPTDHQREILEQAVEFIEAIVGRMRAGITVAELHAVGVEYLTSRGHPPHGYFEGFWPAFGHQMGMNTEGPFISGGVEATLEPGMVMAVEIVMGTPETGGISHEECVIVHADRVEVITDARKRWW
ncbi:MAG: M24 family metallopeptidase [Solirubrobacteraceae bacterium]